MAAASALYLAAEWGSVRERSLLLWSGGFAIIAVGCVLALLRSSGHMLLGIWFPNGLLICAHWLFLAGVAAFTHTRLPRLWWLERSRASTQRSEEHTSELQSHLKL